MRKLLLVACLGCAALPLALSSPAKAQGTNVAVIDISLVFKNHQRFRAEMDLIKENIKQFEAEIRMLRKKLSEAAERLKQFKPDSVDHRNLEAQLAKDTSDLNVKITLKRKEFLEREARTYYNTYLELQRHITFFSQVNRIGLVLRFNSAEIDPQKRDSVLAGVNRAVVYQNQLDITSQILARINRGTAPQQSRGGAQIPRGTRAQIPRGRRQ